MSAAAQAVERAVNEMKAKKKSAGGSTPKVRKPKAAKEPKVRKSKAPKEKKEGAGRKKAEIEGAITSVSAAGETRLTIEFESGSLSLVPTANRKVNMPKVVAALKALLK